MEKLSFKKFLLIWLFSLLKRIFDSLIPGRPIYIFSDKLKYQLKRGIVLFDKYCIFGYAEQVKTPFKNMVFFNSYFYRCAFFDCKFTFVSFYACRIKFSTLYRCHPITCALYRCESHKGCLFEVKAINSRISSKIFLSILDVCEIRNKKVFDSVIKNSIYSVASMEHYLNNNSVYHP